MTSEEKIAELEKAVERLEDKINKLWLGMLVLLAFTIIMQFIK